MIAIALGVKKWPVTSAIEKFKDLCHEAFVARGISKLPLSGAFSVLYHKSLYKQQPLEGALRRYLSEQPLFGATSHRSLATASNRVAVTATTASGQRDVVIANYNRQDLPDRSTLSLYTLLFPSSHADRYHIRGSLSLCSIRCTSEGDTHVGSVSVESHTHMKID